MKNQELTKELYQSHASKFEGHDDTCVCCGRRLNITHKLHVHMNTNWVAVHPSIHEDQCEELTGHDSQGFWFIGKECAKHMGEFVFEFTHPLLWNK